MVIYFLLLNLIIVTAQLNLYDTDLVSKSNNVLQYNCLRIVNTLDGRMTNNRQKYINNHQKSDVINHVIIAYCMNEFLSKFPLEENTNHFSKSTFSQLSKENIRSEQLYQWSAPVDLIENYQFYLNEFDSLHTKYFLYSYRNKILCTCKLTEHCKRWSECRQNDFWIYRLCNHTMKLMETF